MIIDINTYIGCWPFRQLRNNTAEGLVGIMDEAGIDMAAVSSINSIFYKDVQEGNVELMNEIKRFESRFLPFAIINPLYPAWKKDFLFCLNELGMKGLELYPYYHRYDLTCPEAVELVKIAADMGVPVHLPCSVINMRQRHWMDTNENLDISKVERLLTLCPDTDVIISNGPCESIASKLKKVADLRNGKVYYDFARVEVLPIRGANTPFDTLVKNAGVDRIVFGSVLPFQYIHPQLVRLEYMKIPNEDIEKIKAGNLKKLFGLSK